MTPRTLHTKKSLALLPRLQFEGLEARCMLSANTGQPARAIVAAVVMNPHHVLARLIHVAQDANKAVAHSDAGADSAGGVIATFAAPNQFLVAQPTDDNSDDANPDDANPDGAPVKDVPTGGVADSPIKTDAAATDCPVLATDDTSDSTDPTLDDGQVCDPDTADLSNDVRMFSDDVALNSTDDAGPADTAADDASTGVTAIGEITPIFYTLNGSFSPDAGTDSTDTASADTLHPTDEGSDNDSSDSAESGVKPPIVYMNGDSPADGNQSEPGDLYDSQTSAPVINQMAERPNPRLARTAIIAYRVAVRHRERAIVVLHALSGNRRMQSLDDAQPPHNSIVVGDHTGLPGNADPDLHAIDAVFDELDDSSSTLDSARVAETANAPAIGSV